MTNLYIANLTKQPHVFQARFGPKGQKKLIVRDIPVGQQIVLQGLSPEQKTEIIDQHAKYGMRKAPEVARIKKGATIGMCYHEEHPIKIDVIEEGVENNGVAKNEAAADRRQVVADAIAEEHARIGQEAGIVHQRTEIEVVEQTTDGKAPDVAIGVEVLAEGVEPRHGGKNRSRGKAA